MARTNPLSTILTLSLLLLATFTLASPAKKVKCAKGAHVIAVRGHPGDNAGSSQGYGITLPLLLAIKGAIPHSTNESISYPKGGTVDTENLAGTKNEQNAIASYVKACPKTPIVLMGYSEGATITMNTVCGTSSLRYTPTSPLDTKYTKNVIAIVVYSDGTHMPGQSYDVGDCMLPGLYPRLKTAACDPYADKIQSYCSHKDMYCCDGGLDKHSHYEYFKTYDNDVAKFVKSKYQAHKG